MRSMKQYDNSFDVLKSLLDTEARYDIRKEFIRLSHSLVTDHEIFHFERKENYFMGWERIHPYALHYCTSVLEELNAEHLTNKVVRERLMAMANNML